ncbi:hypothetical protein CAAN3_03S08812 [[Candida] anglica]
MTSFLQRVENQSIFQSLVETKSQIAPRERTASAKTSGAGKQGPPSVASNVLACRNNTDLFYVRKNIVRCSSVNSKTSNYRILRNDGVITFMPRALSLNSSGTHLAVVGDENIIVYTLPANISSSEEAVLPVRSVTLGLFGKIAGQVAQVLWQPCTANDVTLVVLTKQGKVLLYDLKISYLSPQLEIDLKKEIGTGADVVAISFGSDLVLSGCLSLYCLTSSGNTYCVYPFQHRAGKLAVSKEQVVALYNETKVLVEHVEGLLAGVEDGEVGGAIGANTPLKLACRRQYEYVDDLYRQVTGSLAPRFDTVAVDKYVVEQRKIPEVGTVDVQGPLSKPPPAAAGTTSTARATSLAYVGSNREFSALVSSFEDGTVAYSAQLKPLVMKWTVPSDGPVPVAIARATGSDSVSAYKTPIRGFGYVEDSDEEDSVEYDSYLRELSLWKDEFRKLSCLARDRIGRGNPASVVGLVGRPYEFIVKLGDDLVFVNVQQWIEDLLQGVRPKDDAVIYKWVHDSSAKGGKLDGFVVLEDTLTDEGSLLVGVGNEKLYTNEVSNRKEVKKSVKSIEGESLALVKPVSELVRSPFEELHVLLQESSHHLDVESIKKLISGSAVNFKKPIDSTDPDTLNSVHELSVGTIGHVTALTEFAFSLKSRMDTELETLRANINTLNSVKGSLSTINRESTDETRSTVRKFISRQDKIEERLDSIHSKILEAVRTISLNSQLPISDAERAWFKELNSITEQVKDTASATGDGGSESEEKELQKQVRRVLQEYENRGLSIESKSSANSAKAVQLLEWLKKEGKLINLAKAKLDKKLQQVELE